MVRIFTNAKHVFSYHFYVDRLLYNEMTYILNDTLN
ncbi:hypothetical protein DI53_3016 [Sphingobacterium deserti]|uniref:Uncharacterized protein n=1 Tax=Sphingobacterium deserti TaxID=1229276 RepID=A0A0B8T6W4_9SPHI|nr:hypothetical protein DI53_3016 [Sphingobacterium deserti]